MRISDWSSDVCSSDLPVGLVSDDVTDAKVRIAIAQMLPRLKRQPVGQSLTDHHLIRCEGSGRYAFQHQRAKQGIRSEERRVGKKCVSTCRSRRSMYHYNTNQTHSIVDIILFYYECITDTI